MAGKTYKVPIKMDSTKTERGRERDETIATNSKKQKLSSLDQLQQLFNQPEQPGTSSEPSDVCKKETNESSCDTSSSSSNSSSSSDKKKKKKKQKHKKKKCKKRQKKMKDKERKDKERDKELKFREAVRLKEEKKFSAEQRKSITVAKRNATLLLKKSNNAYTAMNLTVQCLHFQRLPISVTSKFTKIFEEMKRLRESAQALQGLTGPYQAPIYAPYKTPKRFFPPWWFDRYLFALIRFYIYTHLMRRFACATRWKISTST
jgi:hypothetical protein